MRSFLNTFSLEDIVQWNVSYIMTTFNISSELDCITIYSYLLPLLSNIIHSCPLPSDLPSPLGKKNPSLPHCTPTGLCDLLCTMQMRQQDTCHVWAETLNTIAWFGLAPALPTVEIHMAHRDCSFRRGIISHWDRERRFIAQQTYLI